jgi:6-pyruvoyl-tetrahydropterin synthase
MFSVRVRDHIMIAHSLPDTFFGPAANMHGATYVVDAEFSTAVLDRHNVVIDIGMAHQVLKQVLSKLNYKNLDQLPEFQGHLTTTEFLAQHIHEQVSLAITGKFDGNLKITLGESHVAWASFESPVSGT